MIKKATSQPQLSTGEDLLHELGMKPVVGKSQKSGERDWCHYKKPLVHFVIYSRGGKAKISRSH